MSIFKAAEASAERRKNKVEQRDQLLKQYHALETPREKLKFLLDLKEEVNSTPVPEIIGLAVTFLGMQKTMGQWVNEQMDLQKEKIETEKYLTSHSDIDGSPSEKKIAKNNIIDQIARRRSSNKNGREYNILVHALELLNENNGMLQKDIAKETGLSEGTITGLKKDLNK